MAATRTRQGQNYRGRQRGRNGQWTRDIAAQERAAHAVRLRAAGMPYAEVAQVAGYGSGQAAQNAVQRALDASTAESIDQLRAIEGANLDKAQRQLWAIIADPGPLVSAGKVIIGPDGIPETDRAVQVDALNALVRLSQRRARLLGMDAPTASVHVRADIEIDRAIEQVIDQLRERIIQGQVER